MPAASDIPKYVPDQIKLTTDNINDWLKNDLLHPGWWVLVALVIICLAVWIVLLDKKRLRETLLFAALITIITLAIKEYGQEIILWDYPVRIAPIFPPLTSVNLFILPLAYSLAYQYSRTAWRFLWATLATTAVFCFAVEPLLSLGGMYELLNWRYWWGFPFYAASAFLVRSITMKIFKAEKRAEQRG